jgi:hypothetical protein
MMVSSTPRRLAVIWGSRAGILAMVVGLLLSTPTAAHADDSQLTLLVTQRWQLASTNGTWTPYVVTLRNDGQSGFMGDIFLVPSDSRVGPINGYPLYRAPISVGRGSERSVTIYVIDAPSGYQAQLRDTNGRLLLRADPSGTARASAALGILSDLPQAEQKITAPLQAAAKVDASLSRFPSASAFPTSAAYLSGLSSLVIDQFDSAALSQAQVQALKDFVGLGGTLIEAGGPSWRRTLLPLPPDLLPMRPTATATAALGPLADLSGRHTDATAQVAAGDVRGGRVVLTAPDGLPLVVEGPYGSGRVIELAFDPFAEPFDAQANLAAMAWSQAISRALSGVQGGSRPVSTAFGSTSSTGSLPAGPGAWAPGYGSGADQLYQILQDTPAAASPPIGILGGLLVAYVLLVGLLNYLFLKAAGRRQLMWISVPVVAVVFTVGAYAFGFGSRGSDFLVTEVQVQRLAPEGAVEAYSFQGVYAPRKGDVHVNLPGNTLASTAVVLVGLGDSRGESVISAGTRPEVLLGNVAVWNMRTLQTLSVTHPYSYEPRQSMAVQAQLRLEKGRIQGKVVNLSSRPITNLELVGASGSEAVLAATMQPGATTNVDVDMSGSSSVSNAGAKTDIKPVRGISEASRQSMVRLAASQALSGRQGELAIIGFTDAADATRIEGERPGRTGVAAIVEPVQLQSADSLAGVPPRARLVSSVLDANASGQVDTYDFDLPAGLNVPIGLNYSLLDATGQSVRAMDVYDWDAHSWVSLPRQSLTTRSQVPMTLTAGERSAGVVRVRVQEAMPGQATLSLSSQTP